MKPTTLNHTATGKTTRVSFSGNTIDVSLPESWAQLSQSELHETYKIMARVDAQKLPTFLFCRLTNSRILRRLGEKFLFRFRLGFNRFVCCWITSELLAELLSPLDFIYSPGDTPVRLASIRGRIAVDPMLHGVSFGDYIHIENYYQGYLMTQDPAALLSIANILYRGKQFKALSQAATLNLVNWLVQLKKLFSVTFPHFFKPVGAGVTTPTMLDVLNNEIRALTGGDVSKEEIVLSIDCWRALTELDFKAKDAEEFNRQMAKTRTR